MTQKTPASTVPLPSAPALRAAVAEVQGAAEAEAPPHPASTCDSQAVACLTDSPKAAAPGPDSQQGSDLQQGSAPETACCG